MTDLTDTTDIDETLLPGVLREMNELIGITATMAIVQQFGGVRLYVPVNVPADHILIELIGVHNAEKLVDRFGGQEHFDIPKAEAALRHVRDIEIKRCWPGISQRELALKYRLTERRVREILGSERLGSNQMRLFEH